MDSPLVYIIILNYNGYKDTIECIKSLEKIYYKNYKIIIVDNNSSDNSEKILRENIKNHTIIQTGYNLGFAGGNNIGIKKALDNSAEYILLLNNDTVVEPDFLDYLVETAENSTDAGIIGGKIYYENNRSEIWYSGGYFSEIKGKGIHCNDNNNVIKEVTFITGCLQLIKSEVFEKVGFLPEEYFIYYEDLDFCIQSTRRGYKLIYDYRSKIYHKCGGTASYKSPTSIYYSNRNQYIFIKKHLSNYKLSYIISNALYKFKLIIKLIIYKGENKKAIEQVLNFLEKEYEK